MMYYDDKRVILVDVLPVCASYIKECAFGDLWLGVDDNIYLV